MRRHLVALLLLFTLFPVLALNAFAQTQRHFTFH
jgi:hypothetical protein